MWEIDKTDFRNYKLSQGSLKTSSSKCKKSFNIKNKFFFKEAWCKSRKEAMSIGSSIWLAI